MDSRNFRLMVASSATIQLSMPINLQKSSTRRPRQESCLSALARTHSKLWPQSMAGTKNPMVCTSQSSWWIWTTTQQNTTWKMNLHSKAVPKISWEFRNTPQRFQWTTSLNRTWSFLKKLAATCTMKKKLPLSSLWRPFLMKSMVPSDIRTEIWKIVAPSFHLIDFDLVNKL